MPAISIDDDTIEVIDRSVEKLVKAIGGSGSPGEVAGVTVDSLTEAVMGVAAALSQIATAIREHTDAVTTQ